MGLVEERGPRRLQLHKSVGLLQLALLCLVLMGAKGELYELLVRW